jgi:hypothetical protein
MWSSLALSSRARSTHSYTAVRSQMPHTQTHTHTQVVISRAFSFLLLHNHFITEFFFKKKSGEAKDSAIFPFLFRFIRELNPLPHPYLHPSLRARTQNPHPPPRAFRLYKTFGFTHPPIPPPTNRQVVKRLKEKTLYYYIQECLSVQDVKMILYLC